MYKKIRVADPEKRLTVSSQGRYRAWYHKDMNPLIVLGLIAGLPVVLTLLLRSNGGMALLALCAGSVLSQFVGADAVKAFASFSANTSDSLLAAVQIIVLLLPMAVTIIYYTKSVRGTKFIINILPTLGLGVLTALLTVPLLMPGTSAPILGSSAWNTLQQFQSFVIGVAIFCSLLFLWAGRHRSKPGRGRGKHAR